MEPEGDLDGESTRVGDPGRNTHLFAKTGALGWIEGDAVIGIGVGGNLLPQCRHEHLFQLFRQLLDLLIGQFLSDFGFIWPFDNQDCAKKRKGRAEKREL